MAVALQVAQHITVLHQGRLLADLLAAGDSPDPTVAEIYLGVVEARGCWRCVISHTYYGGSYVLQGVSLKAEQGSVVAVLGRNVWARRL